MKRWFPPFLVLPVLVVAACNTLPTEPTSAVKAVPMFDLNTSTGVAVGTTSAVFPSTNEQNVTNNWAHVLFVNVDVGRVTLNFVAPRSFYSCFEYRIDDQAPTSTENGGVNFNAFITDGLWQYTCQHTGSSEQITFPAGQYVDIRLSFGAEGDERFDWTRFYVLSIANKDQCKNGDWEPMGFKNQGQCVRFVETGKDSRIGG